MSRKHLVLSGYYGFHNVGDEAILQAIIRALRNEAPDIKLTVLSNDPDFTRRVYEVDAVNRWDLRAVIGAIKESDGLISGGGSLLQDETGFKSIPYYAGIMQIACWLKKPFFVYAQGMGPIHHGYNRWFVKRVLNRATLLTIRDDDSKALLEQIGVSRSIDVVPDPVMGMSAPSNSRWVSEEEDTLRDAPFMTVSVRHWHGGETYIEKFAKAADALRVKGYPVVFVPMHGEEDDAFSREVIGYMDHDAMIAPYDAPVHEKVAVIGESALLIGMRLHALIFAAVTGTPFAALSYDPKIDAFASQVGLPVVDHVHGSWTADELIGTVEALLQDKALQETFYTKTVILKEEAARTARRVVEALR